MRSELTVGTKREGILKRRRSKGRVYDELTAYGVNLLRRIVSWLCNADARQRIKGGQDQMYLVCVVSDISGLPSRIHWRLDPS